MSNLNKAKQEFDKKMDEAIGKQHPLLTPDAKEYVLYEKLLELQQEIEEIKNQLSGVGNRA
jgi:hypothetical protein